MIRTTKRLLNSKFGIKDMSLADVILGFKITRTSDGIVLSQSQYVEKMLEKFGKLDTNVSRTPIDLSLHLTKNNGESVSQLEYSQVIGTLMYLISCTSHDIVYSVSRLSRYTSNPNATHWKGIVWLFKVSPFHPRLWTVLHQISNNNRGL